MKRFCDGLQYGFEWCWMTHIFVQTWELYPSECFYIFTRAAKRAVNLTPSVLLCIFLDSLTSRTQSTKGLWTHNQILVWNRFAQILAIVVQSGNTCAHAKIKLISDLVTFVMQAQYMTCAIFRLWAHHPFMERVPVTPHHYRQVQTLLWLGKLDRW